MAHIHLRGASNGTDKNSVIHYVASTTFSIDKGYSDLKAVGKGSYGVVCSAYCERLGRKVAIKKVTPIAKHAMDAKHVLREVRLMRHMGKHENIVTLEDIMLRELNDEIYLVMELLASDLHRIIQSKQVRLLLTMQSLRSFDHRVGCISFTFVQRQWCLGSHGESFQTLLLPTALRSEVLAR